MFHITFTAFPVLLHQQIPTTQEWLEIFVKILLIASSKKVTDWYSKILYPEDICSSKLCLICRHMSERFK